MLNLMLAAHLHAHAAFPHSLQVGRQQTTVALAFAAALQTALIRHAQRHRLLAHNRTDSQPSVPIITCVIGVSLR